MIDDVKLSAKISGGFAIITLLMVGVSIWVYLFSVELQQRTEQVELKAEVANLAFNMQLDSVQVQQWLSDISATRAMDGLNDGFSEAAKARDSFLEHLGEMQQMLGGAGDTQQAQKLTAIKEAFLTYYEVGKKMAEAYVSGGPEAGNKAMGGFDSAAASLTERLDPFIRQADMEHHAEMDAISAASLSLVRNIIIVVLFAIGFSVTVGSVLVRGITKPLRKVIYGLIASSEEILSASHQMSSSSQELASGASEQAASLEETSASLEEISSMAKQNNENSSQADRLMAEAMQAIRQANETMQSLTASMEEISKASEETQKIVNTIDAIAFQTNLLALNAAVEAARAGEAGAGFAVVADEVRNLAMRAAEAAKTPLISSSRQLQKSPTGQVL